MRAKKSVSVALVLTCGIALFLIFSNRATVAGQAGAQAVAIDADDIGGVVTGAQGPEAGVFVIAETRNTPTRLIKSVVTDDQGRFVVPDLPKVEFDVWVRGYGLVDSPKIKTMPGKNVNLTAVAAPNARAAAQYYPALYWAALIQVPPKSAFPGTGDKGNGISPNVKSQGEWIIKAVNTDGCNGCHQIGGPATRTIPPSILAEVKGDTKAAWNRRILSGQAGAYMNARFAQVGRNAIAGMYADWTDRIAAGELPNDKPSRPQGRERNIVVTMWDWADPKAYLHDEISTDKRNPTVNANGPIFGALEESGDYMPVIDPKTHTASKLQLVADEGTPSTGETAIGAPSPYWGEERIWASKTTAHSMAMDSKGRMWVSARIRAVDNPAFCKAGSDHPSAKLLPVERNGRQIEMYDPKTKTVTPIDMCMGGSHLNFDSNDILYPSAGNGQPWFNVRIWDKTKDIKQAQGWSAFVLDYNGNGKRDAYTEPNQPADPMKDRRLAIDYYGTVVAKDGSVWGSIRGVQTMPGAVSRFVPGSHPPETSLTEYYEVPWNNPKSKVQAYGPRGLDVDSKGVVWTVLSSGHLASFDRSKCKVLNGPTATGQHCPEGWSFYPYPGPNYKGGVDSASADAAYYNFNDEFDILGLGKDVPLFPGNLSESLLALMPDGKFLTFRVPYPMGFYAKGLDGRIDDPKAGWKGRGIFTTYATRTPFHTEGGLGETSKLVKFQLRPAPTAK
jgi:hypothetical protein